MAQGGLWRLYEDELKTQNLNICLNININMVVKTITVREEAYEVMKRMKHGDESFSELFMRISNEKENAVNRFFGSIKIISEEAEIRRERYKKIREDMSKDFEKRQNKLTIRAERRK